MIHTSSSARRVAGWALVLNVSRQQREHVPIVAHVIVRLLDIYDIKPRASIMTMAVIRNVAGKKHRVISEISACS